MYKRQILDRLDKNDRRVSLLFDRLQKLNTEIGPKKINIQYGNPEHVLNKIFTTHDIDAVFCNEDYEPYAISRDKKIKNLCQEKGVDFFSFKDQLIFHKNEILSQEGKPTVYTLLT